MFGLIIFLKLMGDRREWLILVLKMGVTKNYVFYFLNGDGMI